MKRRKFLKKTFTTGLAAGVASSGLLFPNIVSSKKKHTWVAVSAFDKAGILGRAFSNICDEITRISNGALNIRLFHANELVSAFESFDVVQVELVRWDLVRLIIGLENLPQSHFYQEFHLV